MKRRELLKTLALGGAVLATGAAIPKTALASTNQRFWVFVSAAGGWDTTNNWDPKGSDVHSSLGQVNHYHSSQIRQAGNIRYAAVPEGVETQDKLHSFTQKHYQRMMVINGVDQGTNSHAVGTRVSLTGAQGKSVPVLPAMLAAPNASNQAMAFIANGAYDYTGGLVAPSKLLSQDNYKRLVNPDDFLGSSHVTDILNERKQQMLDDLMLNAVTDNDLLRLQQLSQARQSSEDLGLLIDKIPGSLSRQTQLAATEITAAAFSSGIATSATFRVGGFDTHDDNDQRQFKQMDELLTLVDHLWEQLVFHGIENQTTIMMVSDLGRKPHYGENVNGKGHWPISSVVMMGADVIGNTVVGATDNNLKPLKINPSTLQLDDNGTVITSASIHASMRRKFGLADTILAEKYPIGGEEISFFG